MGGLLEGVAFGNYNDPISYKLSPIPFLVLWGMGGILLLLIYKYLKKKKIVTNNFYLAIIATIIGTIGECITGKISEYIYNRQLWNERDLSRKDDNFNSCFVFCDGYNSLRNSSFMFIFSFLTFNIFDYLKIQ